MIASKSNAMTIEQLKAEIETHLRVSKGMMMDTAKKHNHDGKSVVYCEGYIDALEYILSLLNKET